MPRNEASIPFWLSDHLLASSPELDVVATLSLIASRTSRIKLGPSVFLLNLRHPLITAKAFATLDYLSNGRMVMAVGTGANLADYAACGIPTEGADGGSTRALWCCARSGPRPTRLPRQVLQGLVKRGAQEHMSTAKSNRVCCGYSAACASIAVAGFFGLTQTDPFAQFLVNVVYPLSNYPPQPPGFQSAPLALSALTTDICCACPTRNADLSLSRYVATFAYEFSDENAPLPFGIPPVSFPLGAYHTAEIQYLIDLSGTPPATFTTEQQQLSDTMIGYWTQFAKMGNPNSAGAPAWSPFSASIPELQSLVPPAPVAESDSAFDSYHRCSTLWDTL